jgi:hypothetical protein
LCSAESEEKKMWETKEWKICPWGNSSSSSLANSLYNVVLFYLFHFFILEWEKFHLFKKKRVQSEYHRRSARKFCAQSMIWFALFRARMQAFKMMKFQNELERRDLFENLFK